MSRCVWCYPPIEVPFENQSKGDAIRALSLEGKSAKEIVRMGYSRSYVYNVLDPKGRSQRPAQAVLQDILSLQVETLRILRKLAGEPPSPFADDDPGPSEP